MKKIIIPFIFALCASNYSFAQSFVLSETGPLTITESLPISLNAELEEFYIDVKNVSSEEKKVKVERTILDTVGCTDFYYCWNLCFGSSACQNNAVIGDPDQHFLTFVPGETKNNFSAHYKPKGQPGLNSIQYCFFDIDNQ